MIIDSYLSKPKGPWRLLSGSLVQIDTGLCRAIWGVSREGFVYKLGQSRRSWKRLKGRLIHVSSGEGGVWGVNRQHNVYYRSGEAKHELSCELFYNFIVLDSF